MCRLSLNPLFTWRDDTSDSMCFVDRRMMYFLIYMERNVGG